MNAIAIPYHLFVPAIASIAILSFILAKRKQLFTTQPKKRFCTFLLVFLTTYGLIVGAASFYDIYYQWDLNRYDLDGDGFFSPNEITPEQEAAIRKLTNDVGRNLSVVTGLVFSAMLAMAAYLILLIRDRVAYPRPS